MSETISREDQLACDEAKRAIERIIGCACSMIVHVTEGSMLEIPTK
jgi:hypothetical protein